jgi:hypothetical protein
MAFKSQLFEEIGTQYAYKEETGVLPLQWEGKDNSLQFGEGKGGTTTTRSLVSMNSISMAHPIKNGTA